MPKRRALAAYLDFVAGHKEVYRIIDEAEFVDPEGFRRHYVTTAERIAARLGAARDRGELRDAADADRRRGPGLGDHGHERLPRAALRGVGRRGSRGGRANRQPAAARRACRASASSAARSANRVDVVGVMIEAEPDPQHVAAHVGDAVASPSARAHQRCASGDAEGEEAGVRPSVERVEQLGLRRARVPAMASSSCA